MEPKEAAKVLAPVAISLGVALCTRGIVAPVAIGALSGAGYTAMVENGTIKNEPGANAIAEFKVIIKLAAIEEELKKRPDVTSIQTAFATGK